MTTRMVGVLGADAEPQTGDILLSLQADTGKVYGLRIARGIAALFAVTIVGQVQRTSEKFAGSPDFQPATLTGCRKFELPDKSSGLRLDLDHGLPLHVVIDPKHIPVLQAVLTELLALAAGLKPSPQVH